MSWLMRIIVVLALLAGVGVLVYLATLDPPEVEDLPIPEVAQRPEVRPRTTGIRVPPKRGGYFAGRVVDVSKAPVDSAHVLLVAYNPGDLEEQRRYAEALQSDAARPDPELIPRIGDYRIAAEKITDKDGVFRVAAGQAHYVTHVVAYRSGYFPTIQDVQRFKVGRGGAREGIEIVLEAAGRVMGVVLDHETNEPIPDAIIDVNLQNPTRPPPDIAEGEEFGVRSKTGTPVKLSQFSVLQNFVAEHLGERVWGIPFQGSNGLRFRSDASGKFELGPLGDAVQLEFIVTHPDYAWTDYDNPTGKTAPRRTVVPPGATVRKELRLVKGQEIEGQVLVRETGEPVVGATIEARSISAYHRHWWYRHRSRKTATSIAGRFRIAGLARGSQNLAVKHPSFGVTYKTGVEAGEKNVLIYVEEYAGLVGRITGMAKRPPGGRVEVNFEAPEKNPTRARLTQRTAVLDREDRFEVTRMRPGKYLVWVRAGAMNSQPQEIELSTMDIAEAEFALGGGATFQASFFAPGRPVVDPVTVNLYHQSDRGERDMGSLVTRQGEIDVDGLLPGRYRLRARSMGYVIKHIADLELPEGRITRLPPIELSPIASLTFKTPLDENDRPLGTNRGMLILEIIPQGQEARRVLDLARPIEMPPGEVTVRARVKEAGLSFEQTYVLKGGATTDVIVKLRKR